MSNRLRHLFRAAIGRGALFGFGFLWGTQPSLPQKPASRTASYAAPAARRQDRP
jgi:hypothetical protein